MKYIIMCGGKYSFRKQMTKFFGETIVERTIRLLKTEGVDDIAISTNDERFSAFAPILRHENNFVVEGEKVISGSWVNGFYPTDEPVCYLFGDVVYSQYAIKTIVERKTESVDFFAASPPFSRLFIKEWAEPFGFKVTDQKRFRAAIDFINANLETGIFRRHPIAWELWQVLNGWNVKEINYGKYVVINDYTCDIDKPEDAPRIEAMICMS